MTFNKIEKKWIYLCIALLGGAFFWLLGENGYVMGGDSELYINFGHYSGVQPLYPLFIQICRKCFGPLSRSSTRSSSWLRCRLWRCTRLSRNILSKVSPWVPLRDKLLLS